MHRRQSSLEIYLLEGPKITHTLRSKLDHNCPRALGVKHRTVLACALYFVKMMSYYALGCQYAHLRACCAGVPFAVARVWLGGRESGVIESHAHPVSAAATWNAWHAAADFIVPYLSTHAPI